MVPTGASSQPAPRYLESIFIGSEDIRMQLPEEAKAFDKIDKAFRDIMTGANAEKKVVKVCTKDNMNEMLSELVDRLDQCQKSLSDYLDTKRFAFPRFFFISDDELLSILGSSNPEAIQQHLLKLFIACNDLHFARAGKVITGMGSPEKEQ